MSEINKFGFKVGDRFEAIGDIRGISTYSNGSIVEFAKDDDSDCPEFKLIKGHVILGMHHCDGLNFEYYDNLKKID